jgi:hypothetical protein
LKRLNWGGFSGMKHVMWKQSSCLSAPSIRHEEHRTAMLNPEKQGNINRFARPM